MTTEEFERWLRQQQAYCVRQSLKRELTDDEILLLLEESRLTEKWIQSVLQRYIRIKSGEIKIPDAFREYLRNSSEEDEEDWEEA